MKKLTTEEIAKLAPAIAREVEKKLPCTCVGKPTALTGHSFTCRVHVAVLRRILQQERGPK